MEYRPTDGGSYGDTGAEAPSSDGTGDAPGAPQTPRVNSTEQKLGNVEFVAFGCALLTVEGALAATAVAAFNIGHQLGESNPRLALLANIVGTMAGAGALGLAVAGVCGSFAAGRRTSNEPSHPNR